jgi:dienelactone hydrolase
VTPQLLSTLRLLLAATAALSLLACAQQSHVGAAGPAAAAESTPDSGAFVIAGDPSQSSGAPWSFRGSLDGVQYELTGVLLVPRGSGPFPAVVLSHGSGGNARFIANEVGRTMVTWGFVCIAVDYTHAADVSRGAPGGPSETGASQANVLRAHMTRQLLRRIPYVDNGRVAAHGHSLGAYLQVAWLATYPNDVQVASQTGGGVRPPQSRIAPAPTVEEAARITVPYQLHHGSADETVPLSWDERLARALTQRGVENALYVYDGGHLAPRANPLMFERVRAWFAMHGVR